MKTLIKDALIVTLNKENKVINNGFIIIENSKIKKISDDNIDNLNENFDKIISAEGRLVMPGFVNAHMHCYSTFARGISLNKVNKCFVEILENLWWRLDKTLNKDDLYYSTATVIIEAIKSGTTTFIDHHASPNYIEGSLDILEKAFKDIGMRGVLCYETSDRDGKDKAKEGIKENIRFIKKNKDDNLVKGLFGLHASFTVDNDTLEKAIEEANKLEVGIHIHCAEDHADQTLTLYKYKDRVIDRLDKFNGLNQRSLLAHCIWLDESEKMKLAENKVWILHNPRSNMNNAVGIMDFIGLKEKGINICIGSDGMTPSILPDIYTAHLIHKHEKRVPYLIWNEIEDLIRNNNRLTSSIFKEKIGTLEEGSIADIVIFDYLPPTPLTSNNFLGHLLFGFSHVRAKTVIINGEIVMENLKFTKINEEEIYRKSQEQCKDFWKRF